MTELLKVLRKSYNGNRYRFEVIAKLLSRGGVFSIRAIHKNSKCYSSINNVNQIMDVLEDSRNDESYCDPVLQDSIWISSKKRVLRWFKRGNKLFANVPNYSSIESYLDYDRECGEWENRLK